MNLLDQHPTVARVAVADWLAKVGEPEYRVRQILPYLWQRPTGSWQEATTLPQELRDTLASTFPLTRPRLAETQTSTDGTVKFLWDFGGNGLVESVLIPEGTRRTLCISSQVGCAYA